MATLKIKSSEGTREAQFPSGMSVDDIRSFLQRKYSQQAINGQSDILQPVENIAAPYEKTLVEKFGTGISDLLTDTGVISNRYGANQIGENLASIGEFLPGIGDATAGDEFGRAVAQGDKFGMAMAGLGVIPVAGDALKKAVKVAKKNYDVAFKPLQAEYRIASATRKAEILKEARVLRQPLDFANSELTRATTQAQPKKAVEAVDKKPNKTFKGKVYHQTSEDFDDFDLNKGADGTAWFTSDKGNFSDPSSSASAASGKGKILERDVDLKKVAGFKELDQFSVGELRQQGYDGAVLDGDVQVFDNKSINLPMDEASRTARAKDLGFEGKTLYHGTGADITEFKKDTIGSTSDTGFHGEGFYFSEDPAYAGAYAPKFSGAANVLPVKVKSKNPFIRPSGATHGLGWRSAAREEYAKVGIDENTSPKERTRLLKAAGYDSVIIPGLDNDDKQIIFEQVIFEPENIRSKFAKFDPKNIDKAGLLGGLGALTLGVGASQNSKESD